MAFEQANQPRGGSVAPSGELTDLAHNALNRLDNLNGRLMKLLDRVRPPEPMGVETAPISPNSLIQVMQRVDGQLDAAFHLIDRLENAI